MGFHWPTIKMPKFMSIKFLAGLLLLQIKFIIMISLHLLDPSQQAPPPPAFESSTSTSNHVLILDGLSPILVPVHVLASLIIERLPIIEYNKFLERSIHVEGLEVGKEEMVCAVCLSTIEVIHKIREISNCCHIFHRECLDRWVDQNQVTCPLCRSMLFPGNKGQKTIHYYQ